MNSMVLFTLLAVAAQTPQTGEPSVRINVWPRSFVRYGMPVRVSVSTEGRDGYLTVLRVDTYGRVHVLYPAHPGDEGFVTAGHRFFVQDRWGREAFAAFETDGRGTILAALADRPYDYSDYVTGRGWSYSLMGMHHVGGDHVSALLEMVEDMAGTDQFAYDVESYWVTRYYRGYNVAQYASCYGFGSRPFGWSALGVSWDFPLYYGGFQDPYFLDPYWSSNLSYDPYGGCYGRPYGWYGGGGWYRGGVRPGIPVDGKGLKKKKGDIEVKSFEPRRRGTSTVTALKPERRDPVVDLGGRQGFTRPGRDKAVAQEPWDGDRLQPRRRDPAGDNMGTKQPPAARPDRPADGGARGRGGNEVHRPPQRPVEKPAQPPAQKPAQPPAQKPADKKP